MTASGHDVRFTPESGHVRCTILCPLCANSGHTGDNFSDENTAMRDMAMDEPFAGSTGGHNLSCMQSSRKSICFHVRIRCFFFASSSFRLHSRNFCRSCDKRFLTASKCVRIERRGAATGLSFWAKDCPPTDGAVLAELLSSVATVRSVEQQPVRPSSNHQQRRSPRW